MELKREQLAAILKVANAMVMADGKVEPSEILVVTTELLRFGVRDNQVEPLMRLAEQMDIKRALDIISMFDDESKKYVASYLGTIMVSDGDIDKNEFALWNLISMICRLPEMTIQDAVNNMKNL